MPIFEQNGKRYDVEDKYLEAFAKENPDAYAFEEREGKKYKVKAKNYGRFINHFDNSAEESQPAVVAPIEDNSEFEENQRLFAEGKPTKGVTTQSIIDAHPELGLQQKQYSEEVLQRSRENVPDYFKSKKDVPLVDRPLGTDAPIGSDERLAARVDIAKKNLEDAEYQKDLTKNQLRRLSDRVSENLNELGGRVDTGIDRFMPANMQYMPTNPVNQELMPEYTALRKAQRLVEESQNIIDEASKKGNTNFMAGLARGFWDNLNAEDYTFGADDAAQSAYLYQALNKAEKGEKLTKAEETLLDAAVINMATQAYYAQDLGRGYGAGSVTAESIPFMLEMAINPISSAGKASAKALLKYGLKKFGSKAVNKAVKAGTRLATDALSSVGMAATTGAGDVLEGATDRMAKNYNYGFDENGRLKVDKKEDTMGFGEALGRSFATRAVENQSEMIFRAFDGAGALLKGVDKYIPGGVNTFFDAVKNSKVGQLWRGIKNSPIRKEIAEATKVGGIAEEYLEEVYNNFANVALGEMTMDEALDLDNNIDTFLGLAPTQAMFAMLGLGGMAATRYQTRRDIEDLRAVMNERQREALDGLLKMGSTAEIKDVRAFIRNTMADQTLTIAEKRNAIEAAYDVAKQKAVNDIAGAEIEDKVAEENTDIDSKTDTSTGMYAEAVALVSDGEGGLVEQPGNIVGYIGGQPIFVPEGMENTEENRIILKPGDLVEGSIAQAPAEEVKASNEEMIRDEAEAQADLETRYAPEVLNAQMVQGKPIDTPSEQIIPISPMPEGNGWVIEVYAKDTNNKVAAKPEVKEMTTEEFRDILQAQLDAEQATIKAEQAVVEEQQQVAPQAEEIVAEQPTIATEEAAQPVVEEVKPQAPVIPTKQDGSFDFVAYGKEGSLKELGNTYGEKMPHKVAVTAKAFADDVVKAKENLDKANEALDNAPIGREQKAKEAQIKAQQAYEAVKNEADFWAEMDADIKAAQAEREAMLNPQVEVDMSEQPMTVDEFVAQQLANGNITLTSDSFKKETGYGEKERKKFPKMFRKAENGGMSIERAGERLMEIAAEEGLAFFDQEDANAGRDALINFLGSVYSWGDITGYVRNNREAMAKKESEAVRDEMESFIWNAYHMTPEEYATQREIEAVENPYENVDLAAIDAIFAEKEFESQTLNQETNESGRIAEGNQGESGILSEEQVGDNGGNQPSEKERNAEGTGNGTQDESKTAQESELTQKEGESVLDFAARVAEEQRRKPLRERAREWSEALGVDVVMLERVEEITDERTRIEVEAAHAKGNTVPGWVTNDGKVYFLMSDISNIKDVDETYIHEVVAHIGLKNLLGKQRFAELCDKVWDMMPKSAQDYYMSYPGVKNHRNAADEYIAHLAEKQNLTPEEKTIWDNIVKAFRELLDKALNGIIGKAKLTDKDIAELIRASYANLKSGAAESVSGEGKRFSVIEHANEEFNKQLDDFKNKVHKGLLSLGAPQEVLRKIGVNVNEITISPTILHRHLKKHHLDVDDLKGLASAIQNPILSYKHGKRFPNLVIVTEMNVKGGKLSVSLELDEHGSVVEISNVKSVHNKEALTELKRLSELSEKELKDSLKWVEKEKVSEWLLRLPYKDERTIDSQKLISIANIINSFENPKTIEDKSPSFRVIEDKNGRKSLVGLHNISESKLKKAIKQGGLANPSMAVIDLDKQSHVDYGNITLIAPSSLIDKKSGKNIGTYTADAWTPIYPNIEKRMSDKGAKIYSKSLESVPSELRNKVRLYFNAYLEDGNTSGALNYWFLHDTGKNPPLLTSQSNDYTNEELDAIDAISNAGYYSALNEEEKQKVLDLFIEKQGGKDAFDAKIAERIETMKNNLQRPDLKAFMKNNVEQKLQEIQEYGYDYEQVSNFYSNAQRAINNRGKIDEFRTFRNAQDIVNNEGLQGELNEWLADKEEQFGVEEYLFVGYNNNGDRKYLPNTLENASKLMRKEGRAGATGLHGFNHFVATLAPNAGTLTQINKKKGNLSTQEEYDAFREKWGDVYHELAKQLQPDATGYADYGYYRLEEMPTVKNPKEYVKKEYGIELSDEFMKKYNEFVSAIKNDFPARYFETKFERPVYLNEFAAAVVPQGTSKDVVDALTEAGLPVEEYESGNNEARMAAVDKVSSEMEGVRFRVTFSQEEQSIIDRAKADETYMKAPNGKPTNLTEKQWAQVRTKAFKKWFGDWEKPFRIEKLRNSEYAKIEGDEISSGELTKKDALEYGKKIQKEYKNADTGNMIQLQRGRRNGGINEVLQHNYKDQEHLKSVAAIPQIIEKSIYIQSEENKDKAKNPDVIEYQQYVCGLKIGSEDYTVLSLIAVDSKGNRYYDHNLTRIEKTKLLDLIKDQAVNVEDFGTTPDTESTILSGYKAKKLVSVLQVNSSKIVDENGEPLVVRHRTPNKFNEFSKEKIGSTTDYGAFGLGFYFSPSDFGAWNYGYNMIEAFLNLKNPLVLNNSNAFDVKEPFYGKDYKWGKSESEKFTEWIKENGYDGVHYDYDGKHDEMVAFEPNQIKSATDNVGTFDEGNNDIRFRISDKARQLQADVDKFTSKYNSKPVVVIDSNMTDKELERLVGFEAKEVRDAIELGLNSGYNPNTDKIYIMTDNVKDSSDLEDSLFHENLHQYLLSDKSLVVEFFTDAEDAYKKNIKQIKEQGYKAYEVPEELFVRVVADSQVKGNFAKVFSFLSEEGKEKLTNLLKENGYDIARETEIRTSGRMDGSGRNGSGRRNGDDIRRVAKESSSVASPSKVEKNGRAREIRQLFDQVADNGLRGVVGDKAYDNAMFEMYRSLPMEARERVAMDALNNHGADMGKAMDKFIGESYDTSLWDVVVGAIRNMLRKKGYDIRFSENDIRYLVWRNRQKLNRNSIIDMAEDIDTRYRLKVGEYEGSHTDGGDTPDGGGTRFRTKKPEKIDIADERSEIIKSYDKVLKSKSFNFQEAFQDRMLSLKVLMEEIEKATGKKAKSFEDAYKAENQLGSVNRPMQIKWLDTFYKPLLEEMKKLSDKYGRENVERYIYCKSGLERNEVLRQRDADEAYNEAKEELDEKLAKNEIDQAQYQVLLAEADKQRTKTLTTDTDYSGIRGLMFNTKADELFNQYKNGNISEAEYKKKVADLKKNEEQEIKDWKKFAEDQVQLIESKASKSELDALWGRINAATNETLRIDFESGMIDRETYEAEKNMMKYYVPLRNWENTTAEDMYEYRHDMTPAVTSNQQKAKGRKSQADNPIATIAIMAQNAIVRGNRNKMKMKLYSFVVNRPTDLASVRNVWYVRDANQQWVPQYADTSAATSEDEIKQIMEQFEIDMQKLEAQGDAYRGKLPFGMKYRANRSQKNDHVVPVMINGKEYAVYINGNPRAAQAVNGLTNAEGIDDAGKWIDAMKRWYGAGLTSWNPDFIIPNLVRDTIHASTMTFLDKGVVESAKYMWNVPKMFAQVAKEVAGLEGDPKLHQYFEEFVANGGETGYTAITTLDDYKKEYNKLINEAKGVKASVLKGGKEAISKIATILEAVNRIAEDTNRFNAYVTSRESGENIVNSIDAAKNITVNFNRKGALAANNTYFGKIASWMSRWILFFNPSVQGMYQIMTKSKANPKRATALGATILSTGFLAPMLNEMLVALFGDDEDDYWNQSDFKRRNNWMLFTGNGYVTIPLPPIFRELYGIGDIMYGVITGHITPQRAVYDVLKQVQSAVGMVNLLPEISQEPDMITYVKGFAPDLAAPILDVVSNTNFMGRPIAKWETWNESSAEYERVYKGVSPQWTELSKLINEAGGNETRRSDWWGNFINPAMMEHLFTSYGGGIGKTINNLAGMAIDAATGNTENMDVFRKAPIVPRFYTPTDEKSVYPGINRKYYEFEYQFNNASKSLKKAKDGVNSGEHPEWQKYIDEMGKNGEAEFIKYFKKESKKLKKLQDKLKENPNDQEAEKKVYDKKAEIATESLKILKGDNK